MNKLIVIILVLLTFSLKSYAKEPLIIRDDEIESALANLLEPLFRVAKISEVSPKIFIVDDKSINAYVQNNNQIFINSGLLIEAYDNPDIILGVLAHEIGHIKGGHLAKFYSEINDVSKQRLATMLLGAVAAISVQPELGMAIISGSNHLANRNLLKFSRQQERAADKIALELLEKTHNSAIGLKKIMEYFKVHHNNSVNLANQYNMTHPLVGERLENINKFLAESKYKESQISPKIRGRYNRAIIKLYSYLEPKENILQSLKNVTDLDYNYSKAIILFRIHKIQDSLAYLDKIIKNNLRDPYFYELKGQILFENGNLEEGVFYYKKSYELKRNVIPKFLCMQSLSSGESQKVAKNILMLSQNQ
jgi:predicted Zn-dependent protease